MPLTLQYLSLNRTAQDTPLSADSWMLHAEPQCAQMDLVQAPQVQGWLSLPGYVLGVLGEPKSQAMAQSWLVLLWVTEFWWTLGTKAPTLIAICHCAQVGIHNPCLPIKACSPTFLKVEAPTPHLVLPCSPSQHPKDPLPHLGSKGNLEARTTLDGVTVTQQPQPRCGKAFF